MPARLIDHGPHRPRSHPVIQHARQGVVSPRVWHEVMIANLEVIIAELIDQDLDQNMRERYERALERGHRDNLRWVRQT